MEGTRFDGIVNGKSIDGMVGFDSKSNQNLMVI